jgi:transmembrane protein 132
MYALLAVFCAAILLFAVACSVYASRFKRAEEARRKATEFSPPHLSSGAPNVGPGQLVNGGQPDPPHAHDWVWLGRYEPQHGIFSFFLEFLTSITYLKVLW